MIYNSTARVEETKVLGILILIREPGVVFTAASERTEVLAVQLGPHVVAEADKCCPVAVTSERLTTAADTAACRERLVGSFISQRGNFT